MQIKRYNIQTTHNHLNLRRIRDVRIYHMIRYCMTELTFKHLEKYLIRLSAFWAGESPLRLGFSAADPLTVGIDAFFGRVDVVHCTGILAIHKHFDIRGVCEIQMKGYCFVGTLLRKSAMYRLVIGKGRFITCNN